MAYVHVDNSFPCVDELDMNITSTTSHLKMKTYQNMWLLKCEVGTKHIRAKSNRPSTFYWEMSWGQMIVQKWRKLLVI